ncbi:MAG: glutamine--fructose-6-phosphate transaminase (isomerizing) [Crenarchaeota archaeon]|nr:MAG: glutamine--fructose-6-phosphate transaminase (isomerizing) [Thermoproteota archaeon]RDJ33554.1 MAG: glutamine--fructose-6-phosphate transaminase (isomerizing) [Thermoproteota archaeon]RDJ38124.1 MAG: glutamine--fructose-6-phosphate transaminase (isomerizing) [Thermoproteota archaeon]RDJ39107.1 MAG: glutamine--fructose-6-phosphate transaminase (isomerizing) [Thermoproteota archaeon]
MCSIIGYYGIDTAAPILVKGLKRMEYRGYDSVGVATKSEDKINLKKGVGKVSEVNNTVQLDKLPGTIGIGHTRWATHGKVTDKNAHPHPSNSGRIAIVHNGIIENFSELKKILEKKNYTFKSETDSEVIANLLQMHYDEKLDVKESLIKTLRDLKGHYAFVAMFEDGTLAAARFHEPLIIGVGKESYFLSSDVLGFIEQTDDAIYVDNGDFVLIDSAGLQICNFDGTPVKKQITKVSKEFADAYKGDYAHFTLKEISEQPDTIIKAGENTIEAIEQATDYIKHAKNVYITGSGTSYNAALVAKYLMSKYAKIKLEPIISSELPFSPDSIEPNSILIAISQSGESADVLEAVNIAKKSGAKIISIVNLLTSSLVQESSVVIGMNCGPEIGVAATKSFTSQLGIIYKITEKICAGCIGVDFEKISALIAKILSSHSKIKEVSKQLKDVSDIYILGRGIHYPIASEAALKLKELTYIHAEGIPGGELKHGPLALMDSNVFVVIINPNDSTYNDTITSAREIKARGAKIIGISDKKSDVYDYWIEIPTIEESMFPIIEIIPIQLLAYYSALEKETDPDYPRNLAKSVTVK